MKEVGGLVLGGSPGASSAALTSEETARKAADTAVAEAAVAAIGSEEARAKAAEATKMAASAAGVAGEAGKVLKADDPSTTNARPTPVTNNGTEVAPTRAAIEFSGGAKVEDEPGNSRTRVRVANEKVWLQHEGVEVNSAKDQRAAFQAALDKASTAWTGTVGVVSGEPGVYQVNSTSQRAGYGLVAPLEDKVVAGLHVPKGVLLEGVGVVGTSAQQGSRLRFNGLPAGSFGVAYPGPSKSYSPWLRHWSINTQNATPGSYATSKVRPANADAILHIGGLIEHLVVEGEFRHGVAMLGDHAGVTKSMLGGWSAIGWLAGNTSAFDNFFLECILAASFCSSFVEAASQSMNGLYQRCHLGYSGGPHVYTNSTVATSFMEGVEFDNCSFEGGGRGLFVDDEMKSSIKNVLIVQPQVGEGTDGPLYAGSEPGDPTQPKDALIKAGSVRKLTVIGTNPLLSTCGPDDANGCVIRASNVSGSDLGYVDQAVAKALQLGKPFMRISGSQYDNTAMLRTSQGREPGRVRLGFRTLTGTVKASDVVRRVAEGGPTKFLQYKAKQFDSAGKVPAGIAVTPGVSGEAIPVALPNPAEPSFFPANTAHLGGAETMGVGAIPSVAKTGVTALTAALNLGSWASTPRLLNFGSIAGATILLTTLGDLPLSGQVSIGSSIVTYTGTETVEGVPRLTGCSGGSGSANAGTGLGRVAKVESTANFGVAPFGGLLIGTVYATYGGVKEVGGVKYIYGISASKGGGEIAAGTTVTDLTVFKVEGSPADYPEGPAGAYCPHNNAQWAYEAFREDMVNSSPSVLKYGYFMGISRTSGTTPFSQYYVTGGTTLNAEATLPTGTLTVKSTAGFPSSGKLRLGTKEVTYTGITGTTFTGCTGGTETFTVGQPVTPVSGGQVANESPVRPRYSAASSNENDKGLVTQMSGPADANGYLLGSSSGADEGGRVVLEI